VTTRASSWRWRALRAAVLARDRGRCYACGLPGADEAHHVIPASMGGPDELWNLRAAHRKCH
jgi:5-methylcytosine-specific restriction endonuclease McrA